MLKSLPAAFALILIAAPALAGGVPRVVFDDITNSYFPLSFVVPSSKKPAASKDNNGHGNNLDGVDSSNPGQGQGGPNAEGADSDPTVDDEGKGGGAAPSKDKNQNQNENQNQGPGQNQSSSKSSSKSGGN